MVWEDFSYIGFPANTPAPGNFYDWKAQNRSFEDMAATHERFLRAHRRKCPEEVAAKDVTWNLFSVLGVKPALGRDFLPDDDRPGAAHVVMLSHPLWRDTFAGDPQIVGKAIELDGAKYAVIGVMPAEFEFRDPKVRVWVPVAFSDERRTTHESHYLQVVARLKPGVSLEQANADLAVIAKHLAEQYPVSNTHVGAFAVPLRADIVGNLAYGDFRAARRRWICAADRVRKRRKSAACARYRTPARTGAADVARSRTRSHYSAVAYRKRSAGGASRACLGLSAYGVGRAVSRAVCTRWHSASARSRNRCAHFHFHAGGLDGNGNPVRHHSRVARESAST